MAKFNIRDGSLIKCLLEEGETNVIIPNSVTSIGEGAFASCGELESLTMSGFISLSALKECFFVWDEVRQESIAPVESEDSPLPNLQFSRHCLEINLSEKAAKGGNIYAKRFCALMLLIQRRLEHPLPTDQQQIPQGIDANPLVYMPPEMWLIITHFCYQQYLPKLDITTINVGLDELIPGYENQDEALTSRNTDMNKLQQDWSTSVIGSKVIK